MALYFSLKFRLQNISSHMLYNKTFQIFNYINTNIVTILLWKFLMLKWLHMKLHPPFTFTLCSDTVYTTSLVDTSYHIHSAIPKQAIMNL
jgi:hypothetical protein